EEILPINGPAAGEAGAAAGRCLAREREVESQRDLLQRSEARVEEGDRSAEDRGVLCRRADRFGKIRGIEGQRLGKRRGGKPCRAGKREGGTEDTATEKGGDFHRMWIDARDHRQAGSGRSNREFDRVCKTRLPC